MSESAGTIDVTAGTRSAVLEFVESAGYPPEKLSGGASLLPLDTPIRVEGGGATVPAFELTVLPAELPSFTTTPTDAIAVDQAFVVTWTPVAADKVVVRLDADGAATWCVADGSNGSVVFSTDLVAKVTTAPAAPSRGPDEASADDRLCCSENHRPHRRVRPRARSPSDRRRRVASRATLTRVTARRAT